MGVSVTAEYIDVSSALKRAKYWAEATKEYNGTGIPERIKHHWEYLRTSQSNWAYTIPSGFILGGAAIGYKIGEVGDVFSSEQENSLLKGISRGVGGVAGGIGGFFVYMLASMRTNGFQEWRRNTLEEIVKVGVTRLYGEDEVLGRIGDCAISANVLLNPVVTPTGGVYDHFTLVSRPKDSLGRIEDPLRNNAFEKERLAKHSEMAFVVNKRILTLLEQDLEELEEDVDVKLKNCLENVRDFIKGSVEKTYEESKEQIEKLRTSKKISVGQYREQLNNFFDLFRKSLEDDLDWEKEWGQILEDRLKYKLRLTAPPQRPLATRRQVSSAS